MAKDKTTKPAGCPKVLGFIKEAFCVDGKVEFVNRPIQSDWCIKCTDKKRGIFYLWFESEQNEIVK